MIRIQVELPEELAESFAEFLKRAGYHEYRPLAISDQEAYAMQAAGDKLRVAFAELGYSPR